VEVSGGDAVRKIEAVIRPDRLDDVQRALKAAGYPGVMVSEMSGHGRQHGGQDGWPEDIRETFLPKVKLEIVVAKGHQDRVVKAILDSARTGSPGDGKIFISDVRQAIRVRTGEKGPSVVAWVGGRPASRKTVRR
jgi:nitrogen regulatory protein P-II 1